MKYANKVVIRELKLGEVAILENMLYESIYQPDEANPISRDVVNLPEVNQYIHNFGQKEHDYCLVADLKNTIIGAVWIRILADKIIGFGNVDDKTPEFAIALYKEFRKQGIGTMLMQHMIFYLSENGYSQTSLSVQKENYALKMYQKLGFKIVKENRNDYVMVLKLNKT